MKTAEEVMAEACSRFFYDYGVSPGTAQRLAVAVRAALREAGYALIKAESVDHKDGRVIATGVVQWMGEGAG